MSAPPFVPTKKQREQVEVMTGLLIPQKTIARLLDIDDKTLRKHFRAELDHGREKVIATLKGVLFNAASQNKSLRASTYLLDRMGIWPQPEAGTAAAPQQVIVRVHGGIAAVEEPDAPPG